MRHILNVQEIGAIGDGKEMDSIAINRAIDAHGDDTPLRLLFPEGDYKCLSIRLRSNIEIELLEGCRIIAAEFIKGVQEYDYPEENPNNFYQDFGHSHWRNSLFYAVKAENIKIFGKGEIIGNNLFRESPGPLWKQNGEFPNSMKSLSQEQIKELAPERKEMLGRGNKAFGFCDCREISIEGIAILNGGHFAILATNVAQLRLRNLLIDTNRDGIDIDCCQDVLVEECVINSPNDDAIVLKSSLARGKKIATKNIDIVNCQVSGFDQGSVYNKTFTKTQLFAPDQDRVTGRIKIGTETNGDFENIKIRNCKFIRSRGLAIESVDGANIKGVLVENIEMEEVTTSPLFIKLGARLRGPKGTPIGSIEDIKITDFKANSILGDYCAMILGLEDKAIENIEIKNISLEYSNSAAQITPSAKDIIETTKANYPEPSMHGITPASGLWIENVLALKIDNLNLQTDANDSRQEILVRNSSIVEINGQTFAN